MRHDHTIAVIIPVLNEEGSIGNVLDAIPDWVDDIIVADNGSTDSTAEIAAAHGGRVISAPQRGYGSACLCAMDHLQTPDIIVFIDGDFSDHPEEMDTLVDPIIDGDIDLVIGSRVAGQAEPGALTSQAAFGNWLATKLIRAFWGVRYTDLGPFRAIRYSTLLEIGMADPDYGWTVEMQIKAALHGVPATEVPVRYRKRIGTSKVSGTLRGVVGAGYKILGTIFVSALFARHQPKTDALVIFSRYPEAGHAKTRLIPKLGPDGAAQLQRQMTQHTLNIAPPLHAGLNVEVRFEGGDRHRMQQWLGPEQAYRPQGDGNLGDRMLRAFDENFVQAYEKVVIIGTDCPELDSALTAAAFAALDENDIVIGPATDGGYYLIGMRIHAADHDNDLDPLFEAVDWGTETVRAKTLENTQKLGFSVALLDERDDIDLPEDIPVWERAQKHYRISVIIPALNEAANIESVLENVAQGQNIEIIVVDGGSTDDTVALAENKGAKVISAPKGRASQMNAGAEAAEGPILLFLHADTRLPKNYDAYARRAIAHEGIILGAFSLKIDAPGWGYRYIESTANWRSVHCQMPYGDQALFMRRDTFQDAGQYPDLHLMEDFTLVRTLRSQGHIAILNAPAKTSPRRWQRKGRLRTTLFNIFAYYAYPHLISAERLAKMYHK